MNIAFFGLMVAATLGLNVYPRRPPDVLIFSILVADVLATFALWAS